MRMDLTQRLFSLRDEAYRDFTAPLVPSVEKGRIIGVRLPALRLLAKEMTRSGEAEEFTALLPHFYLEENDLHAFIISRIKDYDKCVSELDRFLPFVDNWATCDSISPAAFAANRDRLADDIRRWLASAETYTVRFSLRMLMNHYLDADFSPGYLKLAAETPCREYYTEMMLAWYFATALAKQWDAALPYLRGGLLPDRVRSKAIQKAVESRRISPERKEELRCMRRRG
ncbi:MAG: DNA alkylation repair protein [Oscillospiraceae bacterium]|nr:DNA alkylation repair protein [Oscillospiraceae bacterium]